jgi:hypothetical protein
MDNIAGVWSEGASYRFNLILNENQKRQQLPSRCNDLVVLALLFVVAVVFLLSIFVEYQDTLAYYVV